MALAPEWMSYKQEMSPSSSQGSRSILGKERERGSPKYGKQRSYNNLSYLPPSAQSSYALDLSPTTTIPFACSVTSPPAPPHAPPSILGDPSSRVLNRSKSSPGFGSPKSTKQKKSPDRSFERAFPSFKQPKPKAPKPSFNPSSYGKSHSQPNLLNNEKAANWQQQKLQSSSSTSSCAQPSPLANSSTVASPPPLPPAAVPPAPSPPLPPPTTVTSPPLTVVPEIDKLKQLIPTAAMPPKSVRVRGVVGPPLPLAKKPPAQPGSPSQANSLAAYFRKATSEPSLMHHKGQGQGQGQGQPPKKRGEGLLKEAVDAKLEKRSNFFQNIIKQEELGVAVEDDSPIGNDYSVVAESITPTSSPPPTTPPPESSSSPPLGLRSPLPEDMEDEERFMRTLGWVPEDEDPVPVLAEEEIADVRVKIFLSKSKNVHEQDGVPLGIDVDVQ